MFEAIALSSRSAPGRDFQIGELAESLLYYGTVHLVGNGGLIAGLSTSIGTLQTLELIERGYLRIHFEKQMLGIQTNTDTNGRQFHDIVKFGAVDQEPKDFIRNALEKAGWERYQAKTMASRFAKKVDEVFGEVRLLIMRLFPGGIRAAPIFLQQPNGRLPAL